MSKERGRQLTELRRSGAAGSHGKTSVDRYNNNRAAIAEEVSSWDTIKGGTMTIIFDDDFGPEDMLYDPDLYGPSDDDYDLYSEDDYEFVDLSDPYDSEYDVP